jgi:hypothetical protein
VGFIAIAQVAVFMGIRIPAVAAFEGIGEFN